jgi:hypothetical protein
MDPILSISQGMMKATLDKILEQKDQTLEDGQTDKTLTARLHARVDAAGLQPDKSRDGSSRSTSKTG